MKGKVIYFGPVVPARQLQINESPIGWHCPPFKHGRVSHTWGFKSQFCPVKPGGHEQEYMFIKGCEHNAPFEQGFGLHSLMSMSQLAPV